jgi:hypothetical protein
MDSAYWSAGTCLVVSVFKAVSEDRAQAMADMPLAVPNC